jgi:hypothetical protein
MSTASAFDLAARPLSILVRRHVLFPNRYAWYVLVSALDIMLTVTLLVHLGAREVNMIAQQSIELFGTWGLIGLKFLSVILVVLICEWVGRRRYFLGRRVATAAIFISLFPVTAALGQVAWVTATGQLQYINDPWHAEFIDPSTAPRRLPGVVRPPPPPPPGGLPAGPVDIPAGASPPST